jgi:primosomal protein N' (replication factor Y)
MAETLMQVAEVAFDARTAGSEALYTYRDRGSLPGQAYLAPLGSRSLLGWVIETRSVDAAGLGFAPGALKGLGARAGEFDLSPGLIALVRTVACEYLCPIPVALSAAVPPGASKRLRTVWRLLDVDPQGPLQPVERETVALLRQMGGALTWTGLKDHAPGVRRALARLRSLGMVEAIAAAAPATEAHRLGGAYRLTPDQARVDAFLAGDGRTKPAQTLALMRLQGADEGPLEAQEIKGLTGATTGTLKALIAAGLLEIVEPDVTPSPRPTPNAGQREAIAALTRAIRDRTCQGFLLFGVTGSGKTEVYLSAAQEALRQGRQTLYLVPEIALTAQSVARLRARFGDRVAVMHSRLAAGERLATWQRVRRGEAPVVLGTRSALFAPLEDIGLIVVDEEHDGSYKQDSAPKYHAHRLVEVLAGRHGCPFVLGSATPSLETAHAASTGRLARLDLPVRATPAPLPAVHVVDLRATLAQGQRSMFSPDLALKLREALARGEQAILFMNRRAYAPILVCRACGYNWPCPNCAVTLSFHKRDGALRCHHCDHRRPVPDLCPVCRSSRIRPIGAGAQKVEDSFVEQFPGAPVVRLDRDVARAKGAVEEVLARFGSRRAQVLVGTQMVAKGLDFAGVTLVGVIAADVSLNLPDFRASERAYQLLSQVAGRAGRGDRPGEVVIQTFAPEHVAVRCAVGHDYAALYEALIEERRAALYPPFVRLVAVECRGEDRRRAVDASSEVRDRLSAALGMAERAEGDGLPAIAGPADCPLERLNGLWRRRLLAKLPPGASPEPVGRALAGFHPAGVQVLVDVDPYSLE